MEKARRVGRRASTSEHLHPGLRPEYPLLIGSKDQRFLAGQEVRLGADVPLAIKEKHPQELAGGSKEMHRDDADRTGAEEGSGGHSPAGERHRR
jgi:hypothetical protein